MQHRITVAKRRRTAGAVAALAVVLAGTAAGLANLPGGDTNNAPVQDPDAPAFAKSEAGRTLLASVVSDKGDAQAALSTFLTTDHVLLNANCFADGRKTWYEVRINGEYAEGGQCSSVRPTEPLGALGVQGAPGQGSPWKGLTPSGGQMDLEIITTRGDGGPRVTDPTAYLAAGVYELPEPRGVLAGYEIYDQAKFEGRLWQLESQAKSEPGAGRWESSLSGSDGPDRIALVYVENVQGQARVLVNGALEVTMGSGGGTTVTVPAVDGERRVEVRLTNGEHGTIGIAWYSAVD